MNSLVRLLLALVLGGAETAAPPLRIAAGALDEAETMSTASGAASAPEVPDSAHRALFEMGEMLSGAADGAQDLLGGGGGGKSGGGGGGMPGMSSDPEVARFQQYVGVFMPGLFFTYFVLFLMLCMITFCCTCSCMFCCGLALAPFECCSSIC
ncbi:hypothetical protein EMIHUDRAFT_214076 [Emiliania huxleyi CCMP1516]|uniref:Uncharacterized protein n=2 Tax=Emiliania huxleyi TaxID=2903 RepID=A0A0D3IKK1_EMIH1|nr:hypothetical protein EMIHUDRAFT_214076 [Emiliania huxleyi CCMP1516]EOD11786.1 hypothetical protein EMIHUDRAFT_214076 [Emiliania huxleyi CCMP1516]|eukprot:XP_005764215.1 hypothetical protein EMIHUDRAFT_214076 [Emiliania huxleyi CCMP1516]